MTRRRPPGSPLAHASARQLRALRLAVWWGRHDAAVIRESLANLRFERLRESGVDCLIEPAPDWQHSVLVMLHFLEQAERAEGVFGRPRAVVRGRALRLPCCIWVYSHTH